MALSQSWNGGGLLAGIGGANMNAPQANDVNATLALIRDNNAQQASGANNMGLQALQGLGGVAQAYQQSALAEGQKAFNQAHAQAWATGDTSLLRQFALQNPAFVEKAQQAVGHLNDQQRADIGSLAAGMRVSLSQGPEAFSKFVNSNGSALQRVGADPGTVLQMGVTDPQQAQQFVDTLGMSSLGGKDYFDAVDKQQGRKIDVGKLQETIRSNQAGEAIQVRGQDVSAATARRGQDITARGQDIAAATSRRGQDMAQERYNRTAGGTGSRSVQLADGRSVTVSGKVHGSGANAFYEGVDNDGNVIRVPTSSISAPATSAASAQNYAMAKDLGAILNAPPEKLNFMTGVTGSNGSPSWGAEVRSRVGGAEQRQLFNATQRIQGKMRNQGIASARDMGASGINTVAEAKMYFQGMPQVDYSSPDAMQQSLRDIQRYTDQYNSQYSVNVGSQGQQQPAATQGSVYTSKSGIQFKVK
ncbi:phage DNA ejection protein [Pantoea eucrina]|uniref:phage DNA ejection protein n=1 Tax=Pantoea eucrina TaxID=472693 RepID=UPI000A247928|nr:phage DNA ejection protein [Pantoea eucrina]ORM78350.1 DNA transfer protein [Pantoea eucrina]